MSKVRVDTYVSSQNYIKMLEYQAKHGIKTLAQVANALITQQFNAMDNQGVAVDRLNQVIQGYIKEIAELKHQIRQLEVSKHEIKTKTK